MGNDSLVRLYEPPTPPDEPARQRALERYRLLDTPVEEAFEDIIDLAIETFKMPIGLITLLDARRQWFKSRRGLQIHESERFYAFCAFTILDSGGMIVSDAYEDPRFLFNHFVTGSPFIRFYAGTPLLSPDGHAVGTIGVADRVRRPDFGPREFANLKRMGGLVVDEAELRLSQIELHSQKSKLEFALSNANMGHWIWDRDGGIFELPATIQSLFAEHDARFRLDGESSLRELLSAVHAHDRPQVQQAFSGLLDEGRPLQATFRLVGHDAIFWVELHAGFEPGSDQRIVGTVRDITEQERWRHQMIRSDRIHALGCLGAGVAHEINNPLSVVSTNLYLLNAWFQRNKERLEVTDREYLTRVLELGRRGVGRIETIVDDMLELSRNDLEADHGTNPADVLGSVVRLFQAEVPDNCELDAWLETVPPVRGRPSLLAQVFVNLLVNAIDAIEQTDGSNETQRIEVGCRSRDGGERVEIEIRDTGRGLGAEERSKMFNPFFTTKPPGQGTGLGLAVAYSIVNSLGGDICADSESGNGTSVRISLPTVHRRRAEASGERAYL